MRNLEILLLGTGERAWPAPKRLREYISSLGIQLDVMDSVSYCCCHFNLFLSQIADITSSAECCVHLQPASGGRPTRGCSTVSFGSH